MMPKADCNTCIVTVHFGDVEMTKRCLDAISRLTVRPHVVVSNNDAPAHGLELEKHVASLGDAIRAEVTQNESNRGFAAGCNTGIRRAQAMEADHVWLLNNDTEAEPESLEALLACAAQHPQAIIGATVVEANSPKTIQVAGGVSYTPLTTVIRQAHAGRSTDEIKSLPPQQLDYIYGASMLIPATLFGTLGLMDEAYFLYYEELDFCQKAVRRGTELLWCRESVVRHHGGAATGTKSGEVGSARKLTTYHESRSVILYTRKHHPRMLVATLLARIAKCALLIARRQMHLITPVLHGIYDGIRFKRDM